jgi:hypothetical protein
VRASARASASASSWFPSHEQKLEACPTEHGTSGAEEAAPFRVARQVAEVAEGEERVAALLDAALD